MRNDFSARKYVAPALAFLVLSVPLGCSGSDSAKGDAAVDKSAADTAATAEASSSEPAESPPSTVARPSVSTVAEAIDSQRPLILTHAGGENSHPHSTAYAYAKSVKAGVDILDFDVRLTKDGELVIFHDDTVDRTTNGTGRVDQMTWKELHALDAAYWFTLDCSACKDEPVDDYLLRGVRTGKFDPPSGYTADDFAPTRFEDMVEKYPDYVLNIEMKGAYPDSVPVAKELARILAKHHKLDSSVVTAFDDKLAEAFHQLQPTVSITPGLDAMTKYVLTDVKLPADRRIVQIPPEYTGITVLTPDLVKRAHADGLVLWIWPNERKWENEDGYRQLLDMGVDGINAADPEVATQVKRTWEPKPAN